jgi:hypothetical protein
MKCWPEQKFFYNTCAYSFNEFMTSFNPEKNLPVIIFTIPEPVLRFVPSFMTTRDLMGLLPREALKALRAANPSLPGLDFVAAGRLSLAGRRVHILPQPR